MALSDDVERIAAAAAAYAASGEQVTGVLIAEPLGAHRVYVCSFESGDGRTWLALDDTGAAVAERRLVRDAVELAALCEVAEETVGGGDLPELRRRLAEIRDTDAPEGIDAALAAAAALAAELTGPPRLATTAYLDRLGAAARRLEQALGDEAGSPFAAAMQEALPAVQELAADVEHGYKGPLA